MKKRVLSMFMALTLCLTTLPTAVFADVTENGEGSGGTHYVAESGGTQYETVQEILDNMEEGEITLLDSVTEDLTVYAATTIHMNGHSITGNIDATDSLTLNGGTVDGTVKVDGGTLNMTAPAEAEAAITGGLNVVSGSASVSGAKVGVKGTLYFDGTDMLISGAVKAVELDSAAELAAKTLYGSATVNGDTAAEAGFDTDTYKVGGEIAKKLTNKQVGSTTPAAPSLTLTETSKSLTAGKTAVFTANYTGTDTLNAYVQGSAVNGYFTISQKNNGDGTYTVSVKIDEETPGGTYTLFVHEVGNTSVQASATITVTGLQDAAEVNGKQYKSLPRALNAAQDGDTVKLLTNHVTDADALNALGENFTFEQYASIVPVVTKTLTLDLNHKTVDYLEVGFTETNEETQKKETLATGNLTVTGEAAYGRISNLMFMAGALDIRSGEIGGSGYAGLLCDANSGSVTVSNGTVYGLTVLEGASVTVNGGSKHAGEWVVASGATLNITDGTFGDVQFTRNGTIAISGGTFKSIKIYIAEELQPLMSLLDTQKVHAFYKGDDVQDGNATELTDVTVKEHTHTMVNNKCACGYTCPHNDFKDGKCTICGNRCAHTDVGDDGVCRNCQTQMAVKITASDSTVTYSTDFKSAMRNATNGTKITLLADVSILGRTGISGDNTTVTLDLNKHKITGGWLDVGGKDTNETYTACTLKIIGKGSYESPMYGGIITVNMKATLDLSEWEGGTISSINISDNSNYEAATREAAVIVGPKAGTIGKLSFGNNQLDELKKTKLSGGSFNEIWVADFGPVNLGELLAEGYAYQYTDGVDRFVEYTKTLQGASIFNVKVVKCPHAKINEDGHCAYCNATDFVAQVTAADGSSSAYTDIAAAIAAADGGTVKLLANAGEITIGSPLKLDLNGKTAAKLTVTGDVTLASLLPEGCAFKSGSTWITDLTGTELTNVSMAKLPIKSMDYETKMSMTYGGMGTLLVKVTKEPGTGAVTFQWYKVEGGKETAVGSATTKNQFDLSALKLPAGQHTFRFSATCDGYKKMSQDIAVTVQRASISASRITPPTAQENLTYTGQEQALITAGSVTSGGTMQYSLTENGTYSQDIPVGTDAGTYTVWYRVIGDANHNDTTPASVAVRIGQKPLTITGVTAASKPYDGTTDAGITSVTFDGVNLNRGTDYTVTANFDDASVDSGKNITATVTLMEQAAKNYALEQSSFPTTGSIIKAAAPDFTKETALAIINGYKKTYTVTLPALPTLETPKAYGALTYEIGEIKLNDGYYTSGAKVENGELTLPIQKNDVETTGSVGTVTVVIKSANYEDITLTVNVSAKNKLSPVLAGTLTLTPVKITYGEPLSKIKITGTMKAGDTVVEGTFSWQQPGDTILDASTSGHDVGWTFTPKDGNTYTEATGTATVKVNKARQSGEISMTGYTYGQMPSMPSLTEQTGDPNAQVTYYYSSVGNGNMQVWSINDPPALNAGTYRMSAKIGETNNYYEYNAEFREFVVAKATPTYTAPTGLTAKYGQTLTDVKLSNPEGNLDGTWSWMNSSESVGDASTVTKAFQAKFTPTDAVNYNTVENIKLDVTVNKANGGSLKTVELTQKYTDTSEHTYTPDWAGLPAGQDWTFSSETSIVLSKQDFAADGSLLTYAISGGKAGDKITITLKASCDNYEDFTITLNVTLTEKDDQKPLTITGAGSVVYGQTLTLTTTGGSGTGTVTYRIDTAHSTGEATIDSNTGVLTPAKVGSVSVVATKAGDNDYNDVTSAPFVLMIKPATPTGEPNYTKITTSGKKLSDAALTTTGSTFSVPGTVKWVDDTTGADLPDTTTVEANKLYKWVFTPNDSTNYESINGSIKLWHKSTSSGGGGSYYAPVVPDMPMVYWGCTGDAVKTLQEKLNAKGFNSGNVDGIFGAETYAAVTAFQKANSLGVDGIVGKLTWGKLYGVSPAMPVETTTVVGRPMVSYGSRGDAVRKLQELLNALGYDCGSVDGIFGSKTKAAVLAFQKANGLAADGIVGSLTWGKLV